MSSEIGLQKMKKNKQLEMILEQLNEENKRLKFEMEHQKQQYKTEQVNSIISISSKLSFLSLSLS